MTPKIHIIRTPDGVNFPLPTYESKHHVGLLLHAAIPTVLKLDPQERGLVPVGFAFGIPDGLCGQIVSVPSVAKETGLVVLDAPQIVNPADRDALYVLVQNASRRQLILRRGEPIAQLIITAVYQISWNEMSGKTLRTETQNLSYTFSEVEEIKETTPPEEQSSKRIVKTVRERVKAAQDV